LRAAFLGELPARLDELAAVLINRDWPTLQRRLHQIKGIAGSFGFPHISATAHGMETALKNGDEREVARIGQTLFRLMREAG
jgi:HPt (histidine-containing phosphotransfer) domain-containing protein